MCKLTHFREARENIFLFCIKYLFHSDVRCQVISVTEYSSNNFLYLEK